MAMTGAERQKKYADAHRDRVRAATSRWHRERKGWLREIYQSTICEWCGEDDARLLRFHHRDPATKEFEIGVGAKSKGRVLAEMQKCSVLCARCHSRVHRNGLKLAREK